MSCEDIMLSEISRAQKEILCNSTYMSYIKTIKFKESKSRMVVAKDWSGGGKWGIVCQWA
jgi:hypothetical protein